MPTSRPLKRNTHAILCGRSAQPVSSGAGWREQEQRKRAAAAHEQSTKVVQRRGRSVGRLLLRGLLLRAADDLPRVRVEGARIVAQHRHGRGAPSRSPRRRSLLRGIKRRFWSRPCFSLHPGARGRCHPAPWAAAVTALCYSSPRELLRVCCVSPALPPSGHLSPGARRR